MTNSGDRDFWYRCVCGEKMQTFELYAGRLGICPRCSKPVVLPRKEHGTAKLLEPVCDSKRLSLVVARPADWRRILPVSSDPENYRYELSAPDTKETLRQSLRRSRFPRGFRKSRSLAFLANRREDGELIGLVYLTLEPDHLRASVGVKIHHPFHGMGFGKEAVGAAVEFGLETLNLHRISAACDAKNKACIRLFESLGFEREATLKDWAYHPERGWVDCCMFGRLTNT